MQPEQANFLMQFFLPIIQDESRTTRKVIAAVPDDKRDYTPAGPSRTALELAWHIASSDVWFLNSIAAANFDASEGERPAEIKTIADVLAWYDRELPAAVEKIKKLSPEQLAAPVNFFGVLTLPLAAYLSIMNSHSVHHRGQLSAYLRPMGAKVPDIYGGSADEPFEAAVGAQGS